MTTRLEPVAWRFWHEGGWNYSATDPSIHLAPCVEIEPLYAAAPAPDGMREAIVAIINEEVDGDYDGRLHYVGAAADAILAIIAKGEGRE